MIRNPFKNYLHYFKQKQWKYFNTFCKKLLAKSYNAI